jgi:hypothetical protein
VGLIRFLNIARSKERQSGSACRATTGALARAVNDSGCVERLTCRHRKKRGRRAHCGARVAGRLCSLFLDQTAVHGSVERPPSGRRLCGSLCGASGFSEYVLNLRETGRNRSRFPLLAVSGLLEGRVTHATQDEKAQ